MTIPAGTALAQLQGMWSNPYGSEVYLQAIDTGVMIGVYQSTAGSAGKYYAYGLIDPSLPTVAPNQDGQPMGLLINWRSFDPNSKPDPSWNYVSGMSGQIICSDTGALTLQLNHALIASEDFTPDILTGAYVDRLQYDPSTADTSEIAKIAVPAIVDMDNATQVRWITQQDPNLTLTFNYPLVGATFRAQYDNGPQVSATMIATANYQYVPTPGTYLAIAFTTVFLDPATNLYTSASYSGWIDVNTQTMKLQEYYSTSRSWALRFFQSRGRTLYFTPG